MKARRAPASRLRQRSRGSLGRCGVALSLAGNPAFGLLFAAGASAAVLSTGASHIELRTGAAYHSREWEGLRGGFSATQYLLPVDLAWRMPAFRLSAGADFTRADVDLPGEMRAPLSLGEFRGASELNFWRERLRMAAGVRVPSSAAGLGPISARAAELLDEVALGLPRALHPGGPCLVVEAGGQPVRRTGFALQVGMAWERRGSYEILADGRRLDPGDPWRFAGSLIAGRGAILGDLGLRWETSGRSTLDGGSSYRDGRAFAMRAGLRRQYERGRLDVAGTVATRADGSVDPGAPMDVSSLGGGTAGRVVLSGVRFTSAGELGLSLGLLGVRGYPGDLGSAWALEPGLSWTRGLGDGRLGLAVRGVYGNCREGRALRGSDASLSWQREWRP
jgi:hypothetical protein